MTKFDLSAFDACDEGVMNVKTADGRESGWLWTFAGPGHPVTIEQSNRIARERLQREQAQERAVVNGKKWKPEDVSPEEVMDRHVQMVAERLLGWSEMTMGGKPYPFTRENAEAILRDRRKGGILVQALEFLGEETAFTGRSEGTFSPSPSANSTSTGSKRGEPAEIA